MPRRQEGKRLNVKTLVSALIIAGILFGTGVYAGFSINKERLSAIELDLRDVIKNIEDFQLQFLFFDVLGGEATCPLLADSLKKINAQSYEIGRKLTENNPEHGEITDYNFYEDLGERYARILTSYWLLANKMKSVCNSQSKTIIFFIEKDACGKQNPNMCDAQGFVLDNLKRTFDDKLLIFTLHADLKEPSIKVLKEYYKVDAYPTLIIDGVKYAGFQDKDTLLNTLCKIGLCP